MSRLILFVTAVGLASGPALARRSCSALTSGLLLPGFIRLALCVRLGRRSRLSLLLRPESCQPLSLALVRLALRFRFCLECDDSAVAQTPSRF